MGGNSVQVPIMEAFETLKSGITEAITVPWDGLTHPAFKFGQVTTYTLDTPLYVSNFTDGISMQTYNSMSDAQKKAVDQVCTPEWSAKVYRHWYKDQADRTAEIRKSDRKITKIGPAEVEQWRKAAEPVVATWKQAVTKAGYNADEVLKEYEAALKSADALF
jgi:TRAP-type C4-dicarboxylate transport system substrate-binding protein